MGGAIGLMMSDGSSGFPFTRMNPPGAAAAVNPLDDGIILDGQRGERERHSFGVVWWFVRNEIGRLLFEKEFKEARRERERATRICKGVDRRSIHFLLTRGGQGGPAKGGGPVPTSTPPSLPSPLAVGAARAASRVRNGAIHCVSSIFR